MRLRRESLAPLLEGYPRQQTLSLRPGVGRKAGDLDEKCEENGGNEGETFGTFQFKFGCLNGCISTFRVSTPFSLPLHRCTDHYPRLEPHPCPLSREAGDFHTLILPL
jgi:hypothetical protein